MTETPRLGLDKPADDSDDWGDSYREAMDIIDAHPGSLICTSSTRPVSPFDGQLIYETDTQSLLVNADGDWQEFAFVADIPDPPVLVISYVHDQVTPALVWTIVHNLGFYPNVSVADSGGSVVEGIVTYIDINTVQVTFTVAFGGKAYLS